MTDEERKRKAEIVRECAKMALAVMALGLDPCDALLAYARKIEAEVQD